MEPAEPDDTEQHRESAGRLRLGAGGIAVDVWKPRERQCLLRDAGNGSFRREDAPNAGAPDPGEPPGGIDRQASNAESQHERRSPPRDVRLQYPGKPE